MNVDFGEVAMLGTDGPELALQPLVERELPSLPRRSMFSGFLAQQEQPVGIVDGRLGRLVLVVVVDRLGDRAERAAILAGAPIAGLDEAAARADPIRSQLSSMMTSLRRERSRYISWVMRYMMSCITTDCRSFFDFSSSSSRTTRSLSNWMLASPSK
jgi:hypothetical protein